MNVNIGASARGYCQASGIESTDGFITATEARLFQDNISLILKNQIAILTVADYFFCPISNAYCSAGALGATILGSTLRLGHLIIGWRSGVLIDSCPHCNGKALITAFSAHLKSGAPWWRRAFCIGCRKWLELSSPRVDFDRRMEVVKRILKHTPEHYEEVEHFASYKFAWSGDGFAPSTNTRLVIRHLYNPVPFDVLIYELQEDKLRQGQPPVIGLSQEQLRHKFQQRHTTGNSHY